MPESDRHSKTEPATPKRRRDARRRGQVARAPDLSAWLLLLVGSFVLPMYLSSAKSRLLGVLGESLHVSSVPTAAGARAVMDDGLKVALEVIVPLAAGLALVALCTGFLEVGRGASFEALRPKFSKISPRSGLRRLLSSHSLITLARQVAKLAVLSGIGYGSLSALLHAVPAAVPVPLAASVGLGAANLLHFVRSISLLGLLVGLADYILQRRRLETALKMTKQEVRDEARDREGDPTVKAEIKRRSFRLARSRLLAAVRNADVVIANPTHVVVALAYDATKGQAPVVVAKGLDELALRLKQEATDVGVPVVEDPPLARYLYVGCEIGEQIPREIFSAVARLLAFVYSLPAPWRAAGVHHLGPSTVPFDPGPVLERRSGELAGVPA